ncbi:MAG: histone deacetylase [Pseudanabaenaceae cyanobacterium bins.68]|nr:histone deacetylase [Pseudanabaenaceae cyanobacterium bins.68]
MVFLIYSDRFLLHQSPDLHPERPQRLTAITDLLQTHSAQLHLEWRKPTPRDLYNYLTQFHTPAHLSQIESLATAGGSHIDPDTYLCTHSYEVALLAVSAWLDAVDLTLTTGKPSFALARPPGHHALPDQAMGFCLFANGAIAAHYALEQPGINHVAILDWDVHHGNGTQAIIESNPQIRFCSLHQHPLYPFSGHPHETGTYHNLLNLPLPAGAKIADYLSLFDRQVIPFLAEFNPDLLIVSAGYDANQDDWISGIELQPQDYRTLSARCQQICPKIMFGLEGGYDLPSLAQSVLETIKGCQSPVARST